MLGRNETISSTTIPPDLAEGLYRAYRAALAVYNQFFGVSRRCGVVWCDEFKTSVALVSGTDGAAYRKSHAAFVKKRVAKLQEQLIRRKGMIVPFEKAGSIDDMQPAYFEAMRRAAEDLHRHHCCQDAKTKKNVSFGVIRMANIDPCVALSQYLLQCHWPNDMDVRIMTYHSRQLLLLRHEQEKYLDAVMKRNYHAGDPVTFTDPIIRNHLDMTPASHILFIVVATPVEEIGRDHDFDWAVIEPSSYRSFIQLAGRVLRHRQLTRSVETANIAVMQYNLRALRQEKKAFYWPGYETEYTLSSHDVAELIDVPEFSRSVDAIPRIQKADELHPHDGLIDLEQQVMADFNSTTDVGPQCMHGWNEESWYLTALPQRCNPFRSSEKEIRLYRRYEDGNLKFWDEDIDDSIEKKYCIKIDEPDDNAANRLWIQRDYLSSLEQLAEQNEKIEDISGYDQDKQLYRLSVRFGKITIHENDDTGWKYSDQFGLY